MTVEVNADLHSEDAPMILCRYCGRPFALRQDIEEVVNLLWHSGMSKTITDERRSLLETCMGCKSDRSVHSLCNIEMTIFLQTAKGNLG